MANRKKAAASKGAKPRAAKKTATVRKAEAAAPQARMPDMTHALARPLKTEQSRSLLKVSDADLAIASRVARTFRKFQAELRIKDVDADEIEETIVHAETIAAEAAKAQAILGRLVGARLLAEDAVWHDVLKIAEHIKPREKDDPALASEFAFLHEYLASRHGRRSADAGHASPPEPAPAGG